MDSYGDRLAFVRAAEAGAFSAAARQMGVTPSAISKAVSRLESRLGARLFHRSTRSLTPTVEGAAYLAKLQRLLAAMEAADDVLQARGAASGRLRVSLPSDLGRMMMEPITQQFLPLHPELRLEASLTDHRVDLVREGFDLAMRVGRLPDADLRLRSLGEAPMILVASPRLLDRTGRPSDRDALTALPHLRYVRAGDVYPVTPAVGEPFTPPPGPLDSDSGLALRTAAMNGLGVACLLEWTVRDAVRGGALEQVAPDEPLRGTPIQLVHPFGRHLPLRVRLLMEHLADATDRLRRREELVDAGGTVPTL